MKARYDKLGPSSPPTRTQLLEKLSLQQSLGLLYMYEGKFREAASWIEQGLETTKSPEMPAKQSK